MLHRLEEMEKKSIFAIKKYYQDLKIKKNQRKTRSKDMATAVVFHALLAL